MLEGETKIRKERIWYENAKYHVMARSIYGRPLFKTEDDYELFALQVKSTKAKYPFDIHSYCLMTTHFHMLISTRQVEIWKIMQHLMHNYAMGFNRKHGARGHVFDSRYAASLVEDEVYFLEVSRYIHLNPVRAGMVRAPLDYPYSSYGRMLSGENCDLLDRKEVLDYFSGNQAEQYRMFVEGAITHEEKERLIQKDIGEDEQWLPW